MFASGTRFAISMAASASLLASTAIRTTSAPAATNSRT